jgi:hypothetical protein
MIILQAWPEVRRAGTILPSSQTPPHNNPLVDYSEKNYRVINRIEVGK